LGLGVGPALGRPARRNAHVVRQARDPRSMLPARAAALTAEVRAKALRTQRLAKKSVHSWRAFAFLAPLRAILSAIPRVHPRKWRDDFHRFRGHLLTKDVLEYRAVHRLNL